jgi:membrane protease YdiL (CAAX protease family)
MAMGAARLPVDGNTPTAQSKRRALIEIALAYGLIMVVIWTPRPLQRFLWLVAVGAIAAMTYRSFDGLEAMGLRRRNFVRSLWVVGAALVLATIAIALAAALHTLQAPHGLLHFVKTFWAYALWTFVQQFLMQCFFLLRLLRLLPGPKSAAGAAAGLFALAHLPNPILAPLTLVWGFAACLIFLRYRNLYTLGMAHAIFGITIAIAVPGPVVRNMRVGLGYLTYRHLHVPAQLLQPQGPDGIH